MIAMLSILAFMIVIVCIRSYNNKTIDAICELENELIQLQKKINSLIASKPEGNSADVVASKVQTFKEKTDNTATDYSRYMPASQKQTAEVIHVAEPEAIHVAEPEVKQPVKPDIVPPVAETIQIPVKVTQPLVEVSQIPNENKRDYEKFIGENLLSKIGIATLVLGIAYFVKYAIDQNWINEIGRVAIGILLGGAIIALAHKLKNSYRTFSSILVGGGISVLYITITIAFRDYQIFSQTVAFVFLVLITMLSVFLSILYDRKELAIFSLLGGFASPLLAASDGGNYIVLFSYILILNTGMLILAFKKQWRIVSVLAYILTLSFYWYWLIPSFKDEYAGATCFLLLYYIQFYVLALIDHFKCKRQITGFQAFLILSNNLSLFVAGLYIFNHISIDIKGIITMAVAVLNAIPLVVLFRSKAVDKRLLYLLIALVLTFVSLAVPIQLNGCAITMFWAAEAVILLWLWQKSGIKIFKYGFLAIESLVLISLAMDWWNFYSATAIDALPIFVNTPFITGLVITATVFINSRLLKKELDFFSETGFDVVVWFKFLWIILAFFTLFFELRYQMERFYEPAIFRTMIYGLYGYLFAGILVLVRKNKAYLNQSLYFGVVAAVIIYVLGYSSIVLIVRRSVLEGTVLDHWGYFAMHYPALLSIIVFFVYLLQYKSVVFEQKSQQQLIYWLVSIASLFILSFESNNLLLMSFYNGANESDLLKISHNIFYPILWGIFAFILMLIGMRQKNRTLRIISLSTFSLIIAKLYLLDVWRMEQAGRIVAFILLGVIFLLVSFLYQKLKVILKKEEENQASEVKEMEE